MNIAFAGFRHGHIYTVYNRVKENPELNLVGCFEADAAARESAEQNGVVFTYDSYEALLADKNVDIVAIGDYYGIRGQRVIQALKAGKHIYIDKPLCTSLEELDEIERLSKGNNLKVGIMLDLRECGFIRPIRDIILSGKLGEIQAISFGGQHPLNYGSRPMWYFEKGKHGGTIQDIGIHGIDIVEYVTGLSLKRVIAARTWNGFATKEPQFKDCGQFMAEMSNGAGLMADVSYASPNSAGFNLPYYWRFIFWGTNGVVEFNVHDNNYRITYQGDDGVTVVETPEKDEINGNSLSVFLDELAGKQTDLTTEIGFRSTRDILTVQAVADKNA